MSEAECRAVLDFWFNGCEQDAPHIDARMDRWFGADQDLDREIESRFGDLVKQASDGGLDHWLDEPEGRLALIILIDQFRRNIYRNRAEAFACDKLALKYCVDGIMSKDYKKLRPEEQIFFFMPLQHAESLDVQNRSVQIFQALVDGVGDTLRETFETFAHFAELHRDIVEIYGRFPHRNKLLGRENTPEEEAFLGSDGPNFGQ